MTNDIIQSPTSIASVRRKPSCHYLVLHASRVTCASCFKIPTVNPTSFHSNPVLNPNRAFPRPHTRRILLRRNLSHSNWSLARNGHSRLRCSLFTRLRDSGQGLTTTEDYRASRCRKYYSPCTLRLPYH